MKKTVLLAFVLCLLSLATVVRLIGPLVSYPAETQLTMEVDLRVHNIDSGKNFSTIQEAINDNETLDGHTIFVEEGVYYENVVVNKSLSLVGENRSTTIIDANGVGHVIEVTADNVKITGFTIRKSGCGCAMKSGVYVKSRQNVNITNNLIIQNGYGINLDQAHNITIAGNNIADNVDYGVHLLESFNNTIFGNNITSNDIGIYLFFSSNNVIFHNNFINNTKQIYTYNSTNIWDDGYPSGGNYWSDYTDVDQYSGPYQNETGSDGIWDHPYVILGNNQDNYPIVPEFPTWTSTLLLLLAFTVAIAIQKRILGKTRR
jgi:parallel beta-helix repeat protein